MTAPARAEASAPLEQGDVRMCPLKMTGGQCKRVPLRGRLMAYHLSCPACGATASYMSDVNPFEDGTMPGPSRYSFGEDGERLARLPAAPGGATPKCYKCAAVLTVEDGRMVAR